MYSTIILYILIYKAACVSVSTGVTPLVTKKLVTLLNAMLVTLLNVIHAPHTPSC